MQKENPTFFERANNWLKNSITIRLIVIGFLLLLLLIPIEMVMDLIREREYRQQDAINEVSSKWGSIQTIKGLVLTIPYRSYSKVYDKDNNFKLVESIEYAHFLPEELNISGNISPKVRYRGIYEIVVYNSEIQLLGNFELPNFEEWKIEEKDIIWEDAVAELGLSDLRSIQENVSVKWNGKNYAFNPGVEQKDVVDHGISTKVLIDPKDSSFQNIDFSLALNFNGSSALNFIPLGKTTHVTINSEWKDPSFDGAFLPDERTVSEEGFSAKWKVLHLNRSYPQKFRGEINGINESSFGVNLLMPVDSYQKSMRSAKYASMFVALTFLIFFFVQILNRVRIHPIQYIIVGLALVIFYSLLIALSEHISFMWSYIIASIAIVGLIVLYVKNIFKSSTLTRMMGLMLVILYLFIYTIIQSQDYALLMGSIGLFIVLAVVMYLSRNIDWYRINEKDN
jgi:inner membrane protein